MQRACPDGVAVLVGNKVDLPDRRQVGLDEATEFAGKRGLQLFEVSAKTGDSVPKVFEALAREVVRRQRAA
jgi:GTPase SAR1 family protein